MMSNEFIRLSLTETMREILRPGLERVVAAHTADSSVARNMLNFNYQPGTTSDQGKEASMSPSMVKALEPELVHATKLSSSAANDPCRGLAQRLLHAACAPA
jgi:hypothetical protein